MDIMETLNILRYNKKAGHSSISPVKLEAKDHIKLINLQKIFISEYVCFACIVKKKAMHVYKFIFCFGGFIKTGNFDKTVNV